RLTEVTEDERGRDPTRYLGHTFAGLGLRFPILHSPALSFTGRGAVPLTILPPGWSHRAMRRLPLLLLLAASPALAVDCGRLPTGKNPSWQELDAEIARASSAHGVPTEIIKGIAWQ